MNKINKDTLKLIKEFEGLELKAYKDAVGVWTIGYGHTAMAGDPAPKAGMIITELQAEELLLHDLKKYEAPVIKYVTVPLNDNQYGALVSFVYNLGEGNFKKSTLLKKLNANDYKSVPSEMMKWNKAGGKVLRGLTRRREAEGALFKKVSLSEIPVILPSTPVQPLPDDPGVQLPEKPQNPSTGLLGLILSLLKAWRK